MATWHDITKFIRCISTKHLTQVKVDHILHFFKKDVPWDSLVVLANIEGVAGLVYCNLNNLGLLGLLPQSALGHLEIIYTNTKKQTLDIIREAEALSLWLEQVKIPVVALQGLALTNLYEDPGLRPLGDADLMVKPGHKQKLKEFLWQAGYQAPNPAYPDILYKADILLDIHTHILNLERIQYRRYLFPENLTPMWEKATPLFGQTNGLLTLDPFDNFIALAAHALKHSYSRLIWLVDLHEFLLTLVKDTHGWEGVVERAQFWHQERIILYSLFLIENIFPLKVPYQVKQELGMHKLSPLENHLLRLRLRGFSSDELCIALWLCNIKGVGKKLRFIKETVFPKDEIMSQIFDKSSGDTKTSVYIKRTGKVFAMVGKCLHQALVFSFMGK